MQIELFCRWREITISLYNHKICHMITPNCRSIINDDCDRVQALQTLHQHNKKISDWNYLQISGDSQSHAISVRIFSLLN